MSIQAAQRMGLRCLSLDSSSKSPAAQIAEFVEGSIYDSDEIASVAERCEFLTLENEFIPASEIRSGLKKAGREEDCIRPGLECLAAIQDKWLQRKKYESAGIPGPNCALLVPEINAVTALGFPLVLKSRKGGYDGKGTRVVKNEVEFSSFLATISPEDWYAEAFVPFRRELAVMVYLSEFGNGCFPTMETIQTENVCDLVFPAEADASEVALRAAQSFGSFGLFGVELFELPSGEIFVNEIAPRPHNSGHYTLDWGGISQFEQHVRIAMRMPVQIPSGNDCCMANLLGQSDHDHFQKGIYAALEDPGVHVHWYGKHESRKGRKMGHINVTGDDIIERAKAARARFYGAVVS